MKEIYDWLGISKQAHHQQLRRRHDKRRLHLLCVYLIEQTRELHPGMGLVQIYQLNQPAGIGRKAFLELGKQEGFLLELPKSFIRTTRSVKSNRYANLLIDTEFTGVNQLWSVDITYFLVPGQKQTYYLFFIMDVYSRRILGWHAAQDMRAVQNLKALKMALRQRRGQSLEGLIHHSDRGGQYVSDQYTQLLESHHIQISMCRSAYENAHIERVHGTIKNYYLKHWDNSTLTKLKRNLDRAVEAYNHHKPHSSLQGLTPVAYEQQLHQLPIDQRTKMNIFVSNDTKRQTILKNQLTLFY